ncbi:hypothetical protein VI06_03360 [Aquitalea magnusonii]|nr:hypothetical protein VI06_03360 [Aquitalea magnusonii]
MQLQIPLAGMAKQMLLTRMEPPCAEKSPSGKRVRPTALIRKRLETVSTHFTSEDLAKATGLSRETAKGIISDAQRTGLVKRTTSRNARSAIYMKLEN